LGFDVLGTEGRVADFGASWSLDADECLALPLAVIVLMTGIFVVEPTTMVSLMVRDCFFRVFTVDVSTVMLSSKIDVASVEADETRESMPDEDGELSPESDFSTVLRTVSVLKEDASRSLSSSI
jgi:hypothetical protein